MLWLIKWSIIGIFLYGLWFSYDAYSSLKEEEKLFLKNLLHKSVADHTPKFLELKNKVKANIKSIID